MYQNFAMIFFALGYLGSSNAIHSASKQYIESPDSLLNREMSLEQVATSLQQAGSDSFSCYAIVDKYITSTRQFQNNNITKALENAYTLLNFLKKSSNPEEISAVLSKEYTIGALNELLSKYSPPEFNPQLVEIALANIKEVGKEALEEYKICSESTLDSLSKHPSNLVYKSLVEIDLFLSFYERTNGTGLFAPSSQISDEDKKLAALAPRIINSLAAQFGIISELAELVRNADN